MVIATLGCFYIEEYPEALGVILFYRIGEAFEDYAVEKKPCFYHGNGQHASGGNCLTGSWRFIRMKFQQRTQFPAWSILVRPGDRIPLDGIITEGSSQIDTSALTGEPVPVTASEGDSVLSGCLNQTGVIKLQVTSSLDESMVSRVMESMENAAANKPKWNVLLRDFRVYILLSL